MPANIFGERFYARSVPAWHNLGTTFPKDEKVSLTQAISHVVDYNILETPVFAFVDGSYVQIPGRKALVRTPTQDDPSYRPLEVVSNGYKKVDEYVLADIFNDVSKIWPVETVGVINNGQTIFATLDAGMIEIKGDLIHQFFLLTDSKDRRQATVAAYTPIRVVCQNTLTLGLEQATLRLHVAHRGNNEENLKKIAVSIEKLQEMAAASNALFNNMASTAISLDDFKNVLQQSIYPDPILPENAISIDDYEYGYLFDKQKMHRDAAVELFTKFNDEFPQLAETKWAAYNAVVELEDWKQGRGQRQWTAAVFGQRSQVKANALNALLKI